MKKKLAIIGLFFSLLICIKALSARTDIDYCREIAFRINFIGMKNARCNDIVNIDDTIIFQGEVINVSSVENEGYEELLKLRNFMIRYLSNHPSNKLNTKKIMISLSTFPGDGVSVANYDENDGIVKSPDDFSYYEGLRVENSSMLSQLDNPKVLRWLYIENVDDLSFVEQWNDLYYVDFCGTKFTDGQKEYLLSHLQNCEVIMQ